jgi:hypothetical protein
MNQSPPTFSAPPSLALLDELESRQDDVLRALDDLNQRIERAIVTGQMGVVKPETAFTRAGLSVPTC